MNIRKVFLSLFILISSFLFIDRVGAITNEMTTNNAIDLYSDVFKERFENEMSKSNLDLEKIDSKLKEDYDLLKNTYPYYMTIINCNDNRNCSMYVYYFKIKPDITFKFYKSSDNLFYYGFINNSNDNVYVASKHFRFGVGYGNSINDFNNFTSLQLNTSNYSKNNWISYHFSQGNSSMFNFENKHYINLYPCQILYDSNFDITLGYSTNSSTINYDIKIANSYYQKNDIIPTYKSTLQPKTPTVNFSIDKLENNTINGIEYISKERINMKFENYDITKHQVYIAHDVPHGFYEITPNFFSQKYSLDVDRNTTIYLKILDRETQENLYSTSINIRNISVPIPSLNLSLEEIEYLNNDTSLSPLHYIFKANFDYFNLDRYIYKYYYPDYDTIINITENNHYVNVGINGDLIFYVYDKKTNELVYTYTQNISGLFGAYFPQISIKHHEFEYLNCGDEKRVYSESIDIYFSILDNDKYFYEYSMDNVNFVKYNIKDYKAGYYFRYTVYSNSTLYVRIRDKKNNEILTTNSYVISSITYDSNDVMCILGDNYNDNLKAMQKYLVELKSTSQLFNDLFHSFYDNLPSFIQLGLVFAYIILLVFITLILGGWK